MGRDCRVLWPESFYAKYSRHIACQVKGLCREVQHDLIARKAAKNKPISGCIDVGIDKLSMRLYCDKEGRKVRDEQDVYALPFKYVKAAYLLSQNATFREKPMRRI